MKIGMLSELMELKSGTFRADQNEKQCCKSLSLIAHQELARMPCHFHDIVTACCSGGLAV